MAWSAEEICKLAAKELKDGFYVNLGIGMPTNVANYIPEDMFVTLQSENGMLGMGEFPSEEEVDADLINAGKQTISETKGCSYFDSAYSFGMIRGGHIDLSILGALQVTGDGDLANWMIPGKMVKGMGGAMDLVASAKRVIILMDHVSKDGQAKIVKKCEFPLTGKNVVDRIITNYGIFDVKPEGLFLVEKSKDISIDEIRASTDYKISNIMSIK